ncbi:pyridoxal-phosphate dependent enzyme [Chelativorans intermedius]|uniref:Pyridoxal-phosphate dependent enzyme n=1 Tax=Chelativorans intermedius TaxID=515947 RepID=A0ABV6D2M5_9HYPH|nr:pyridoxal-phosphate dependent enzyme [Chelativorans intermedius]
MTSPIFSSILDTIGRTPIVRLQRLAPRQADVFVMLESSNPGGSVKDRLALGIIEAAEREGRLRPGQTVVEATSGNTGISMAMVCAAKGYPFVAVMAENFSVERRRLMRHFGARVVLTPASAKGSGMVAKARELAERHGWFLARQFESEANPDAHSRTTAREILAAFGPDGLTHWVSGFGSGGTLLGVGRVLRRESPRTRIVACEPDNSALLGSGLAQPSEDSHPAFRPHLMQGWSPDFVSPLTAKARDEGLIDALHPVSGRAALDTARDLARAEGILCGISAGATVAVALAVAREAQPGARILAMVPDTGERYLSTPLFSEITETMTQEEAALSRSTPSCRFDQAASPGPRVAVDVPEASAEALDHVRAIVGDPGNEIVMFALEWCEFCWSVRRLFADLDIGFSAVDLDGPDYRDPEWAAGVRRALHAITGAPTIPQIFVRGKPIGGATDLFDELRDGRFAQRLGKTAMAVPRDPYGYLPSWLHPRTAA